MSRHVVATTSEIAPGTCKIVTVKGREIGVFHIGSEFFALINRCPHQGAPLCRGAVVNRLEAPMPGEYRLAPKSEMIKCPWHCWEYDIRTGQSWCDPKSVRARQYQVTIEAGAELVKGPYVAETFPVLVEDAYVIVEA